MLRVLTWSVSVLIPTLGGLHGYRRYYGPFAKQSAEAARLRDRLVFDDDLEKLGHARSSTPLPSEQPRFQSK